MKKKTAGKKEAKKGAVKKAPAKKAAKPAAAFAVDPSFQPIADAFAGDTLVTQGRMMSSFGIRVHGKIFAMFVRGEFVAKLPKARVDALVAAGTGRYFDPSGGRPMKEWISIAGHSADWLALSREAYRFVRAAAEDGD